MEIFVKDLRSPVFSGYAYTGLDRGGNVVHDTGTGNKHSSGFVTIGLFVIDGVMFYTRSGQEFGFSHFDFVLCESSGSGEGLIGHNTVR